MRASAHARRERALRRRRRLAPALLAGAVVLVAVLLATRSGGSSPSHRAVSRGAAVRGTSRPSRSRQLASLVRSFAVGLRVFGFNDPKRTLTLPDGTSEARPLLTYVRYPALGPVDRSDLRDAPAARTSAPFPLVIFGHGFAVTPSIYQRLLVSWARAGYVVAAPVFPRENAGAPGGPDESDLANQPADMSFLITKLLQLTAAGSGPLAGLIDPRRIAVSGQSDGGDTALAAAYDPRLRDRRIGAAMILSGAEIQSLGAFAFPSQGPPLLAVQGTADTINPQSATDQFFIAAAAPKYLLLLPGAQHLPPYTTEEPQLAIVERITTAFLDAYLKHRPVAREALRSRTVVPGTATLVAHP